MADASSPSESLHEYEVVVVDDLSEAWEFINASSSDEGEDDLDHFSFSEEEEEDDAATSVEISSGPDKEEGPLEFGSPSSDISMDSLPAQVHRNHHVDDDDDDGAGVNDDEINDDDDEDEEYDEGYDLDDELVPWGLSDKFGRQRIRKLGKRASPRMNKAKKLAYRHNRPGCVHGKHGFGVHYSYI